ncbi:MAG: UDP-N-acetylmuramoyl-tripeptide--D-alanyl-D-alanine ligase [Patescibacteria group bacterium]|nr:UDP-N-acetylmuramoyl-tripeptide--D-alanyl-D-alanine ligase [Patescibacteria group bacterium]
MYFWQIKEYRTDRFLEYAKRNKSVVFQKSSLIALILFLTLFLAQADFLKIYLTSYFYFVFGFFAIYSFLKKKVRFPEFTKKMIVLFSFSFFALIALAFFALNTDISYLLVYEILFSIVIFFCVRIMEIPVFFAKKHIYKKAKNKREKFKDLIVIGITGSYGKTSTKEFLYAALSQKYNVLKTEGNNNTEIGVANTILKKLKKEHQIFICEMAAYKIGEIKTICDMTKPSIGILTGINQQHIALFGTQENIVKAKFELIESLPENGIAIFNQDNEYIKKECFASFASFAKKYNFSSVAQKFFSVKEKASVWAEDIEIQKHKILFKVFSEKEKQGESFEMNLLGAQNIPNVLATISCAEEFGITLKQCAEIFRKSAPEQRTMNLIKNDKGVNIISAVYSANPHSVIAHLHYLKIWDTKKVLIMPCLVELGKESKKIHQEIGKKIGQVCDLAIILKKQCYQDIKKSAIRSGMKEKNILFAQNNKQILEKINNFCVSGDVILLESRVGDELIKLLSKK